MNREEYIASVKNELGFMPYSEVVKAEEYFRSFFNGGQDDDDVINSLGTPREAAQKYCGRNSEPVKNKQSAPKRDGAAIVIAVVAAVFLFPIWLPMLILSATLMLAVVVCVIALSFGMWLGGGAVIFGTLFSNISVADKLLHCGSGFIMFGIGLILSWLVAWALINLCVWIIRKITRS